MQEGNPRNNQVPSTGDEILARHPLSTVWGDMLHEDYQQLVASLRKGGESPTIVTLDGQVLDGWHRYLAAQEVGLTQKLIEYQGNDPAGYVIRKHTCYRQVQQDRCKQGKRK